MYKLGIHVFFALMAVGSVASGAEPGRRTERVPTAVAAVTFAQEAFETLYTRGGGEARAPVEFYDNAAWRKFLARNYSPPNVGLMKIKDLEITYRFIDPEPAVEVMTDSVSVSLSVIQDIRISGRQAAQNCFHGYMYLDMPEGVESARGATVKEVFLLMDDVDQDGSCPAMR